jgi:2-hydroxychromene-2-carboxylate isomerase
LEQPVFFYDLGDPESYLAGERIMATLPVVPEWEPVLATDLQIALQSPDEAALRARAAEQGLLPLRLPARWPPDTRTAMLTATFAKRGGRAVAYSLAAFRQAFAGGNDLGDENTVLIAAAACEMHPTAVLKGIGLRSVRRALDTANERASAAGVTALPAIHAGERLFSGPAAVEDAATALGGAR